jgi:protein KRI1
MPKDLFADDSNSDEEVQKKVSTKVSVNREYAQKYDQVKRKQELQRLTSKYGADAAGSEDSSSEDDGSEDDDAHYLTSKKEIAFAEVFHKIRTKPEEILRDKETRYFDFKDDDEDNEGTTDADAEGVTKGKQPFRLKDEYQRALEQGNAGEAEDEDRDESVVRKLKPKTSQEKKLRDAFIEATKDSTEDFNVKMVAKGPKPAAKQKDVDEAKSLLREAFSANSGKKGSAANDDESFLEKFFVNELWKPKDGDADSDGSYDWESMAKEEEDEIFYDEADRWEREYQDRQFRHEDGEEALVVQTFPRQQEGQLRKKDTARKEGRKRKESRKEEEANRQVEELKRLKTLKRKEIDEQKDLIAKVAGIKNLEKLGITREFLEQDFNAADFDKKMAAIFDHDYDHEMDDEEMALFEEERDDILAGDDGDDFDEEDDQDAAAGSDVEDTFADTLEQSIALASEKKTKRTAGTAAVSSKYLADDELAMLYPDEALRELETIPSISSKPLKAAAKSKEELEAELDQKVDEYWKLHYHKVAGDVRTRFRYRDVNPETFGLDDMDVLTKDDRQLNMIAPLNCYATYLGKNENTRDRYKAVHRRNSLREISSERKSRRYGDVKKTTIFDAAMPEAEGQKMADEIKERTKRLRGDESAEAASSEGAKKLPRREGAVVPPHKMPQQQQNRSVHHSTNVSAQHGQQKQEGDQQQRSNPQGAGFGNRGGRQRRN